MTIAVDLGRKATKQTNKLSLKGGCTGWSESIHVIIPHCWKSHVTAQLCDLINEVLE